MKQVCLFRKDEQSDAHERSNAYHSKNKRGMQQCYKFKVLKHLASQPFLCISSHHNSNIFNRKSHIITSSHQAVQPHFFHFSLMYNFLKSNSHPKATSPKRKANPQYIQKCLSKTTTHYPIQHKIYQSQATPRKACSCASSPQRIQRRMRHGARMFVLHYHGWRRRLRGKMHPICYIYMLGRKLSLLQ